MIYLLPIFLFFMIPSGLGLLITPPNQSKSRSFSNLISCFGFGLALLIVLGIAFNLLTIPLDWRIFLGISLSGIIFKRTALEKESFRGKHFLTILLILFVICTMYIGGAFQYPWLENDDSWSHAAGIKYITVEKNFRVPSGLFYYINPYPPGYDFLIGMLHQVSSSLYWTLKFFNALIVSLAYLLFYCLAKELSGNKKQALWALFFLACIPCFLSHFIWAHSLVICFILSGLYGFFRSHRDPRYIVPAVISTAAVFLTQPTQGIKYVILLGLAWTAFCTVRKKVDLKGIHILLLGALISLTWWAPVALNTLSEKSHIVLRTGTELKGEIAETGRIASGLFSPSGGSASRAYNWRDYLFAPEYNLINNPIGVGPMIAVLALCGLFLIAKRLGEKDTDRIYAWTLLGWLAFTFLGMNSVTFHLPVGLFAFRFWMLFAVPVSLLAAEGALALTQFFTDPFRRMRVQAVVITCVILTSGYFKWQVNTGAWPWGVYWGGREEIMSYTWMRENLPADSMVFAFKDNLFVIGHDMRADYWREDYQRDFENAFNLNIDKLYGTLTRHRFEYLIIGQREANEFGLEAVNQKIKTLNDDPRFDLIFAEGNGARIYRIQ